MGSERGDGYKKPCPLGEGTGSKESDTARLRKGLPLQGPSLPTRSIRRFRTMTSASTDTRATIDPIACRW
jgi:hypothetical protein